MKKILLILTSLGTIISPSFNLIACNPPQQYEKIFYKHFKLILTRQDLTFLIIFILLCKHDII